MTSKVPLLPFINRNLPQIIDHNGSGLVAYGSRGSIFILDLKSSPPSILDSKALPTSHRGKVLSVSFCKSSGDELLASVGEDWFLRIWNLETSTCIASQEVKDCARVVEWLYSSTGSVVYPELNGGVVKWSFRTNNLVRMKTCSETPVCFLSSNKKCPELLAVGHAVGSISVLNVDNQVLLHKLKAHTMDITSLSWSPVSPTMLLSTSLDQTARLWTLGENKPVKTYNYPKSRFKTEDKKNLRLCGLCHPENPDVIICSNVRGDLGTVIFQENEMPKFTAYDANGETNLKSINIMMMYILEDKKFLLTADHLKISLWDMSEGRLRSSFGFTSGNIYDITLSPINPDCMAIATGDGFLRVWDMNQDDKLKITSIYIHTRIKIMTVVWHPTEEHILAYGSDEGRVGIADTMRNKNLYSYETHHGGAVYCLQWAPCRKIKNSGVFFLYSCGSGCIYIHELHQPKAKPAEFDALITVPPDVESLEKSHSELSWKPDYTCLAVGSYKGFVELYDDQFNLLTRLTLQMKSVESLKWHPPYTLMSPNGTKYNSWLATAGNDENIYIIDSSDSIKGEFESTVCKPAKSLVGHKKRVSSVSWSNHTDGYLASAARDGTVLVWNVITNTLLANYVWHRDVVYAVVWNYNEPDIIYSGGMDNCLRMWKISEQTAPLEKTLLSKHKYLKQRPKEKTPKEVKSEVISAQNGVSITECEIDGSVEVSEAKLTEDVMFKANEKPSYAKGDMPRVREKKRNLFYDCTSKPWSDVKGIENVLKLADILSEQPDISDAENIALISDKLTSEELLTYGFYTDQLSAVKMLETRANAEGAAGISDKSIYLHFMANNVETLLTTAAGKKQLADFLVASAASVSHKFYVEMCEKYAVQLVEEQNYMKASMYFLFSGKPYDAVKTLLDKGRLMEALVIAKSRLPESDPLIRAVLNKVARNHSSQRQTENEAACYLAMKEPLLAAKSLYFASSSKSIYASAYICKKFNFKEEAETYGFFCMEKCLAENDWPTFYKVANVVESLKIYKILVRVHELIFTQIKCLKKEDGLVSNKIFGVTGTKPLIWESKTVEDTKVSFLPYVYNIIKAENILPEDRESLEEIHRALNYLDLKRKKYEVSAEAHITVAVYISQIIVTSLLNDFGLVTKYFMKIFSATHNVVFLPRVMCWLLLPCDVYWYSNEDKLLWENTYQASETVPFTEHFQNIYMSLCKFGSAGKFDLEGFIIQQDISLPDLETAVQQVSSLLSKKTTEESLLLYFSICYLIELRKLAKKGWKFRCYNNAVPCNKNVKEIAHENGELSEKSDKSIPEKKILFVGNDSKQTDENEVKLENGYTESESQNIANGVNGELNTCDMIKDVFEIFPPELDTDTKNKIARHHGWANFSEIENEFVLNPSLDEIGSTAPVKSLTSLVKEKLNLHTCPIQTSDDNNGKVGMSKVLSSLDSVDSKIGKNEMPLEDDKLKENGGAKVEGSRTSLEINSSKIEQREISSSKNGSEANELLEKTNGKIIENGISLTSSVENINGKFEGTTPLSDTEDDHAQCWTDVSLYYILVKYFASVTCKDEYALLYYLPRYLHNLDTCIAEIARKQSKSVVNNNSNHVPNDISSSDQENPICSKSLNDKDFIDLVEENKSAPDVIGDNIKFKNEADIQINENQLKTDKTSVKSNNGGNELTKETDTKANGNTDSYRENTSVPKYDDVADSAKFENEADIESNENWLKNDKTCVNSTNGENNLTEEIGMKIRKSVSENPHAAPVETDKTDSTGSQKNIPKLLQIKREKVYEQIKMLNSVDFWYPDPLDAVSAINGLCYDIFRKNHCKLIQEKFHELLHQVNNWNRKFRDVGEPLKCDICQVNFLPDVTE